MDNEITKEFTKIDTESGTIKSNAESADKKQKENSPESINAENAANSTGRISDDGGAAVFYTAAQVRAMTPTQVRANYEHIIESMKCKTFFGV